AVLAGSISFGLTRLRPEKHKSDDPKVTNALDKQIAAEEAHRQAHKVATRKAAFALSLAVVALCVYILLYNRCVLPLDIADVAAAKPAAGEHADAHAAAKGDAHPAEKTSPAAKPAGATAAADAT